MDLRSERWRIRPLELPRAWRYCTSCAAASAFVCSGRFRVNANKKSLDVWLKYRCASCEETWKLPLFERRSLSELGSAQLDGFARHDPATVWRYAFDVARLRPHVIRVDTDVRVAVERSPLECGEAPAGHVCIHFDVPFPCDLRLDRLLAGELGISRSALQARYERAELRKRVRDGMRIYLLSKNDLTADRQNGGSSVL
jgi:hypothetical protein